MTMTPEELLTLIRAFAHEDIYRNYTLDLGTMTYEFCYHAQFCEKHNTYHLIAVRACPQPKVDPWIMEIVYDGTGGPF